MMKRPDSKILRFFTNKYVVASIIFLAVIVYFDENNLIVTYQLKQDVDQLKERREELRADMRADSIRASQLKYNHEVMEKYGRENYYMKRKGEDIFIIHKNTKAEQRQLRKILKAKDESADTLTTK